MADGYRDIMGIGNPKEFVPYEIGDGWTVVLPGEEDGRRGDKVLVAVSHVEIKLKSRQHLEACLKHLEESDRRLRMMRSNNWDWQRVIVKGNTVRFGVAWYDRSFFERRKNAWNSDQHTRLYDDFGATAEDFKVTHEVLV